MEVKEQAERKIAQLHTRIQQLESKVWGLGGCLHRAHNAAWLLSVCMGCCPVGMHDSEQRPFLECKCLPSFLKTCALRLHTGQSPGR